MFKVFTSRATLRGGAACAGIVLLDQKAQQFHYAPFNRELFFFQNNHAPMFSQWGARSEFFKNQHIFCGGDRGGKG